jgi:hypothetical protein
MIMPTLAFGAATGCSPQTEVFDLMETELAIVEDRLVFAEGVGGACVAGMGEIITVPLFDGEKNSITATATIELMENGVQQVRIYFNDGRIFGFSASDNAENAGLHHDTRNDDEEYIAFQVDILDQLTSDDVAHEGLHTVVTGKKDNHTNEMENYVVAAPSTEDATFTNFVIEQQDLAYLTSMLYHVPDSIHRFDANNAAASPEWFMQLIHQEMMTPEQVWATFDALYIPDPETFGLVVSEELFDETDLLVPLGITQESLVPVLSDCGLWELHDAHWMEAQERFGELLSEWESNEGEEGAEDSEAEASEEARGIDEEQQKQIQNRIQRTGRLR